ncbi:MAG: AAA family ATPase [Sedimenticola sp.]
MQEIEGILAQYGEGTQSSEMPLISCVDLLEKQFDELHWNIEGLLPEGTMLIFGKPKKGKSYLTLMFAISTASGRPVFGRKSSGRRVLYMGLEDSERRLQRRLKICASSLGIDVGEFAGNMDVTITSKRLDSGLIEELRAWMERNPDAGLVVIDMLKKITPEKASRDLYEEQARVGEALTKFSHEYPNLSILVVHHASKGQSDDPFDLASGTTGLSGSYDSLAVIADTEGERILHVTGRDVETMEIPLRMDDRGMYTLEPIDPEEIRQASMSDTRCAVYTAVSASMSFSRKDIINGCRLSGGIVDQQLRKLKRDGLITQPERGRYQRTKKRFFEEGEATPSH